VHTFHKLNEWSKATHNYSEALKLWHKYASKLELPELKATYRAFLSDYFDVLLRKGEIRQARKLMELINQLGTNDAQGERFLDLLKYYELRQELQTPGFYKHYQLAKFCLQRALFAQAIIAAYEKAKRLGD